MRKVYKITAKYNGVRITRTAYSEFQVWVIVNQLYRDGCTEVGMEEKNE